MDTSRVDGVKASLRDGTPRSHPKNVLWMKEHQLDLAFEAEPFDLRLRCRLEGLRQCVAKLLKRVKVTCPIGVCHQEQRRRVSRVVLEPLHFLPEPLEARFRIVCTRYLCGNQSVSEDIVASMAQVLTSYRTSPKGRPARSADLCANQSVSRVHP